MVKIILSVTLKYFFCLLKTKLTVVLLDQIALFWFVPFPIASFLLVSFSTVSLMPTHFGSVDTLLTISYEIHKAVFPFTSLKPLIVSESLRSTG